MRIRIADVLKEERTYAGTEPGAMLELDPAEDIRPAGPLAYDFRAVMAGGMLVVRGTVGVDMQFRCRRCDAWFDRRVDVPHFDYACLVVGGGEGGHSRGKGGRHAADPGEALGGEPEVPEEADGTRQIEGEFADLTEDIRESIILAFPGFPVCRKECRGLCPKCGKNLNQAACGCRQDEPGGRWNALDNLSL